MSLLISKNLVIYHCKCCNLIGYATRNLFVNRYRVVVTNVTRLSFSQKKQCYYSFFEELEELLALNFYEAIVNSGFALVKGEVNPKIKFVLFERTFKVTE